MDVNSAFVAHSGYTVVVVLFSFSFVLLGLRSKKNGTYHMATMYSCPRNSDNKEKCKCRLTSGKNFECVKPNAWNEFRREHIGKYTQRELSLEYKNAKLRNYHVNLCSSG